MSQPDLASHYRAYIACLNKQDWAALGEFVHDNVRYNGRPVGLKNYRAMLEDNFARIPDLHFNIELLLAVPPRIASRLQFDCRPRGEFMGLSVNGKRVRFAENVFYELSDSKIVEVWSVIDKATIESQL